MGDHFVVVDFQVEEDAQDVALELIAGYVENFLSRQPGFTRSTLLKGNDGCSIVHYAQWESEQDFLAAGAKAQNHPDLPRLREFNPRGRGFSSWRKFGS